ncbi:leucine-rich PPR motif-containing protein, mitochondrial isoform X2 [Lampetra planeri]
MAALMVPGRVVRSALQARRWRSHRCRLLLGPVPTSAAATPGASFSSSSAVTAQRLLEGARGPLAPRLSHGLRPLSTVMTHQSFDVSKSIPAVQAKQVQQFEWALNQLDSSVRRTGRVTSKMLLDVFHDICRSGYPSANQALLLIRSCGTLLPEELPEKRTELLHNFWNKLKELGTVFDVSHYNALIKVYLQNDHKFSPTDFLEKMEKEGVTPNRVTYQRLIAAYCNEGDIDGASKILGFMKNKDIPITEQVFNSLVTGHAKAGDMENSLKILSVMRDAGIEPTSETYLALLIAYAERGDIKSITEHFITMEKNNKSLMDRDIMQIIFSLAKAGFSDQVQAIVGHMRHQPGFIPDAMNLCLNLVTHGLEDTAFEVLLSFPALRINQDSFIGKFFLRHCVTLDRPVEKLVKFCDTLQEKQMHTSALMFTLRCALEANYKDMAVQLMKHASKTGLPVRPHFFWPLLTHEQKLKNQQGVLDVLKAMRDMGVEPNQETFTSYVIPVFSSYAEARAKFQEIGLNQEETAVAEIRYMAFSGNLDQIYDVLSSPKFPPTDMNTFRGSLTMAFRKSNDVACQSKITELLFTDSRFKGSFSVQESLSFFLSNLLESMSAEDIRRKETHLHTYFQKLKSMNLKIQMKGFYGLKNLLDTRRAPGLTKDVYLLVENASAMSDHNPSLSETEEKLKHLKEEGLPLEETLRNVIRNLCSQQNLDRALEVKSEYSANMVVAGYATLLKHCCEQGNVTEACNIKKELDRFDPNAVLGVSKYIALLKLLATHGMVQEAQEVLKELSAKKLLMNNELRLQNFVQLLQDVSATGNTEAVRQLLDSIVTLGLCKPGNLLCNPLLTPYLEKEDLSGALDAGMACANNYQVFPQKLELLKSLVEKGEMDLLQKALAFISKMAGELNMLYDIFFTFLETGKHAEALKIIETPGMKARPRRLKWFAERCIFNDKGKILEQLLDQTKSLFECDRDEMYFYMLQYCKLHSDVDMATATWTKMQEENLIPRERTLSLLADILQSNGQDVPFDIPVMHGAKESKDKASHDNKGNDEQLTVFSNNAKPKQSNMNAPWQPMDGNSIQERILILCKRKNITEALELLYKAQEQGRALSVTVFATMINSLLANGMLEDAFKVKAIIEKQMPDFTMSPTANSLLVITYALQAKVQEGMALLREMVERGQPMNPLALVRMAQLLSKEGDIERLKELEALFTEDTLPTGVSRMLFVNNVGLALLNRDGADALVSYLEPIFMTGNDEAQQPSGNIIYVFNQIIANENEAALDKLSAMGERLAKQFSQYQCITYQFLAYITNDKIQEAKFLLERCPGIVEQKETLINFIVRTANRTGKAVHIENILEVVPDIDYKNVAFSYLLKCYVKHNDVVAAKALYNKILADGFTPDELFLKRLAVLLIKVGEPVPFEVPPESFEYYVTQAKKAHQ